MKRHLIFPIILLLTFNSYSQVHRKNNAHSSSKIEYVQNPLLLAYDIHYVGLDLSLSNQSAYVKGNATTEARSLVDNLTTYVTELKAFIRVDSLFIDGVKMTNFFHENDEIIVDFTSPIQKGQDFEVQVYYQGVNNENNGFFTGVNVKNESNWEIPVLYTLSASFQARDWWPSKQIVDDKIDSVTVAINVPAGQMAGANGVLAQVIDLENGGKRYEWESHYPISYYLIGLAVSEYQIYSFDVPLSTGKSVSIQNYIYNHPEALNLYKSDIDKTGEIMQLFSELFGDYPFWEEKYGQILAPMGGGMEHQTMTTLNDFRFKLVAHELGHQWFGDYVTCGSWQDIWLNEGFASYSEYLAREFLNGELDAKNWLLEAKNFVFSRGTAGTVYIPEAKAFNEQDIYNYAVTYNKGPYLLHMMRFIIDDDEVFFNILRSYLSQYRFDNALGMDFETIATNQSGIDFSDFFDQWFYKSGVPELKFGWEYDGSKLSISYQQIQYLNGKHLYKFPLEVEIRYSDYTEIHRLSVEHIQDKFVIEVGADFKSLSIDPKHWILMGITSITEGTVLSVEDEMETNLLNIYPIPATNYLSILPSFPLNDHSYIIINSLGQTVDKGTLIEGEDTIDISSLNSGLYFLHLENNDSSIISRFVKL